MAGVTLARTGDLLEITICRSERRNALGEEEWERLDAAVAEAEGDPTCQFVLIRGSGDFFCSGADLDHMERAARLDALLALIETNTAILRRFERLPQIVLAALNGPAIGIGVHIALCADIIFAVDAAYFWIPEARLGIADVLHFGLLEQRLGRSAAFSMTLLGRKLSAADALSRGLIAEVSADQGQLRASVGACLTNLRALNTALRMVVKRHANSLAARSHPAEQLAASAYVLDQGKTK
jgi:enoyl-CoA hydratase/carnithine racemase